MHLKYTFTALFFACLLPLAAYTWEEGPYALTLDSTIDELRSDVTREKYPDADAVVLDYTVSIQYNADGTYFQVADNSLKILTEKGAEKHRVVSSWYYSSYSRAKVPLVQIIKPDGTRVEVDLKYNTKEITESSDMDSNIYSPDSRVINVTVPGLEVGDVLRCIYVDETTHPRIPNSFSDLFLFEGEDPIVRSAVTISAPEELPLNSIVVKDKQGAGPKYTERKLQNRIVYKWEVSNVPQFFSEPRMPQATAYLQRLIVSTFKDWQEVSRWYWQLCEKHLTPNEALQNEVKKLTENCHTDAEKLRAIFDFVSQKIRYMGVIAEDTAPGYEPHDVTMTFNDRAGVCRDKAALLVTMLRCAGFEAYPALIHTAAPRDFEVPIPYFNHAITGIRSREDGAITLMDSTDETTRELLPSYLSDRSYLLATKEGDTLRTTPVPDSESNMVEIRTNGELRTDGVLALMSEIVFNGINDNAYRSWMLSIQPNERRQVFEKLLQQNLPGCRLKSIALYPENLQDMTKPFTAVITAEVPDYLNCGDSNSQNYAMMRIPRLGAQFGMINFVFKDATLATRRFPYNARFTCGIREQLSLRMPQELVPTSVPQYDDIDDGALYWQRRLSVAEGTLFYTSEYASRKVLYTPVEYARIKECLSKFEEADRKQLIFKRNPQKEEEQLADDPRPENDTPDAIIRERDVTIELLDEHSSSYDEFCRMEVLTYNGVKENSDLTWEYNPAWDEIELVEGRVITPDGTTKEISPNMIHRMDSAWAGSAPRYPAGKIYAVNFPGVEPGSIIEYRLHRTKKGNTFFSFHGSLRTPYPADHLKYTLILPASMADEKPDFFPAGLLKLTPKDAIPEVKLLHAELADGRVSYGWEAENTRRIRIEDNLPPLRTFTPTAIFSTGNWKDYATQIREVIEPICNTQSAAITTLAAKLKGGDDETTLVNIREFIELNIRRTEPDFNELPLSCLTAPDVTLKDGYGNTADIAILYYALLKAAGFNKTEFYLASTLYTPELQELAAKYPTRGYFKHWLIRVDTSFGVVWLNDQSQYGQFGTCAYNHALLLRLKNGTLETLKLPSYLADVVKEKQTIRLNDDGSAIVTIVTNIQGSNFGTLKRFYSQLPAEKRRRHYQKLISEYSQNARPVTQDIKTDFQHYPGEISYTLKVDHFACEDGQFCYLTLKNPAAALLRSARAETRENPLLWDNYSQSEREFSITMPPSYKKPLMMPAKFSWRAPGGSTIDIKCRQSGATVVGALEYLYTVKSDIRPTLFQPTQYPLLQDALKQLQHPSTNSVLLGK